MKTVAKAGKTFFLLSQPEFHALTRDDIGLCTYCGSERECCEPDAREYCCEDCGEMAVYGAEELLIMGRIVLK